MKRRMPKDPTKLAQRRAELKRAGKYKRQLAGWQFGLGPVSQGPAGPVRRIDPAEYLAERDASDE